MVTGNAPSEHRVGHAEAIDAPRIDDRAFRQGWHVRTRLDGLFAAGEITAGEWQCAVEFRDAWAGVVDERQGDPGAPRVGRAGRGHDAGMLARLDSAARLRLACAAIGGARFALCHACAVADLSWRALGRRLGCDDKTARKGAAIALRALASAWAGRRLGALPHDGGGAAPKGL